MASFTFQMQDDGDTTNDNLDLDASPNTISFNVSANLPPVAVNDSPVGVTEDTPFSGNLASNDTLSGDGGNVWALGTAAVNGTVVVNTDGTFTYTPNANFTGADSFTYTLTDALAAKLKAVGAEVDVVAFHACTNLACLKASPDGVRPAARAVVLAMMAAVWRS